MIMNPTWIISCGLANKPIPMPNFTMTTVLVQRETELIIDNRTQNLTGNFLNSTLNSLLHEDTAAIRVTCTVSNRFGSDNASTLIELCGNIYKCDE